MIFNRLAVIALFAGLTVSPVYIFSYRDAVAAEAGHVAEEHNHSGHGEEHNDDGHENGGIKLTPYQMRASGVEIVSAEAGSLSGTIVAPGRVVLDPDRTAKVVSRIPGIVVDVDKNIGDVVKKGEVLARIESREISEAVAAARASSRAVELKKSVFEREKSLWQKKITAEQDYLEAKNAWQEASIENNLAGQLLKSLGYDGKQSGFSAYYELKAPIGGTVIERELILGEHVDATRTAFIIADPSVLWIEAAITSDDVSKIKTGQDAAVSGGAKHGPGKIVFVSPVSEASTGTTKIILEVDNPDNVWRPGDFVEVGVKTTTSSNVILLPENSVQTINGTSVVFVLTENGFEKRDVAVGAKAGGRVEILSGVAAGEKVAAGNVFILKAEAGKSSAEHSH